VGHVSLNRESDSESNKDYSPPVESAFTAKLEIAAGGQEDSPPTARDSENEVHVADATAAQQHHSFAPRPGISDSTVLATQSAHEETKGGGKTEIAAEKQEGSPPATRDEEIEARVADATAAEEKNHHLSRPPEVSDSAVLTPQSFHEGSAGGGKSEMERLRIMIRQQVALANAQEGNLPGP
jgi:hypothetical protein